MLEIARHAVAATAIIMSSYHLAVGFPAIIPPRAEIHYALHLGLALLVLFGTDAVNALAGRRYPSAIWDAVLAAVTVAACGYLILFAEDLAERFRFAEPLTVAQIVLGFGLTVALLDAARRTVGWVLVGLVAVFLVYAKFGNYMPGILWHQGFTVERVIELIYLSSEGIWNVPLVVTANYVFLFVLFGSFLIASGAGTFFTDVAQSLTGRTVGGPAKTAVVASAFMGMLSGAAAANVVTTGSFTIPAMKRAGYKPEFAAGVEAVASTGGQLTPPVMGAAAFIMVEFVGVSYVDIMGFAIIPAILYFLAVYVMVDLEARRLGLVPKRDEKVPSLWPVLRRRGHLILPLAIMVYVLIEGYTPATAGFAATVSTMALVLAFDREKRRTFLSVTGEAMREAPRMIAPVTVACALGGVIAGLVVMIGLGLRVGGMIFDIAGGVVFVALLLTMIVAVILGMGMPTSAAYIILAALLAPGLVKMGVPVVAVHMFIIYCAAKSSITPPVAIASYAAAALAESDPWRTSLVAFKLGLSVFIIPYMFVYGTELLGFGTPETIAWTLGTAIVGILALSVACVGWLKFRLKAHERAIAFVASLFLIFAGWRTDLVGFVLCLLGLGLAYARVRGRAAVRPAP
ncbi:MAG: TRAP transporter fused permease subunit [Proteobacteria bacterium]|nr:TRAP transporter fused permease subunit [Pseudomonadota bacterium]